MNLTKIVFFAAFSFLLKHSAFAETKVNIGDKAVSFVQAPRLTEVLTHLPSEQLIYFPTLALFKHSDALLTLQQTVVADLQKLAELNGANQVGSAAAVLAKEVQSWMIAERTSFGVYYERARLVPSLNPRLTDGVYYLATPARSERFVVYGATRNNQAAFRFEQKIADIHAELALSSADNSFIWVIEPDGTSRKLGVAYWNKQKDWSKPGQQFFIPFASSVLPSHLQDLNSNIVSLLRHRVISA